ncbi:MAG: hypothetical protein KGZ75_07890 [Syntrophomonadaceae bacterium]|nr:hypothetical protein [Syntrophomonadaceae bacterium]
MTKDYLIPRAVVARMEIIGGMGVKEILAIVAGGAVGYVLQLIPAALPLPVAQQLFARFLMFVLPPGAAYLLVKPGFAGGQSLWQLGQAYRRWSQRPKTYYYTRRIV